MKIYPYLDVTTDLKKLLIQILRRASYRSPARNQALKNARISRGLYRCNSCLNEFTRKQIAVDHIKPVVPINGYKSGLDFDANEFAERLFCEANNLQVLCKDCHKQKTKKENNCRKKGKKREKTTG